MKIVTKLEAATRQLDTAIELFFSGGDPISIHTLAASAGNVFADVSERKLGHSWRLYMETANQLSRKELKEIIHREWNFFKHADRDPDATLEFDESTTDHVIFVASLDSAEIQRNLSHATEVYQIWYIAAHPDKFPSNEPLFATAQQTLPDLPRFERSKQIQIGKKFLDEKL
jgi:hypothetical protein